MAVKNVSIGTNTIVHIASGDTMVLGLYIANPTQSTITFSVHVFPVTGAANDDSAIVMDAVLESRKVFYIDMNNRLLLAPNDRIAITANSAGLRATIIFGSV